MAILEVKAIEKSFDNTHVLKDINFSLEKGEVMAIIGSSGSGKTTLLRCLNFLERPDKGTIIVNNEVIFDAMDPLPKRKVKCEKRLHFGLVSKTLTYFLNIQF